MRTEQRPRSTAGQRRATEQPPLAEAQSSEGAAPPRPRRGLISTTFRIVFAVPLALLSAASTAKQMSIRTVRGISNGASALGTTLGSSLEAEVAVKLYTGVKDLTAGKLKWKVGGAWQIIWVCRAVRAGCNDDAAFVGLWPLSRTRHGLGAPPPRPAQLCGGPCSSSAPRARSSGADARVPLAGGSRIRLPLRAVQDPSLPPPLLFACLCLAACGGSFVGREGRVLRMWCAGGRRWG
eukprot:1918070-Rhodomonas_salina.2